MGFVRAHLSSLGLTKADLKTFRFRQDYVDTIGVHHLFWSQQVDGRQVFGNGLKVNVSKRGQVVSVQGSPISGSGPSPASAASAATRVTPSAARSDAARDVGSTVDHSARVATSRSGPSAQTVWSNNDYAKKVWFLTSERPTRRLVDVRPDRIRCGLPARHRRRHRTRPVPRVADPQRRG